MSVEEVKNVDLEAKVKELLEMAAQVGAEQNFFFLSTLERYQMQLSILAKLKTSIESDGVLVTKEYVKNRENIYTHPAVTEYNRTATAANQTVQTLLKVITTLADHSIGDSIPDNDEL